MAEKIIVLGSNCFSGSHFVNNALASGMDVVGISRSEQPDPVFLPYQWGHKAKKGFTFFKYDINNDLEKIMGVVHDFKPEYFVNFASQSMVAQSWENPAHWFKTNVLSTIMLHEKLRNCSFLKKYLHVSTPEVYGSCGSAVRENVNYNPSTPYAVSRAAADMSLQTYFDNYKFPVIFTRAANVYGPGQQLYRIIPRAILYFLLGKKLHLHGGGVSVRSFIHIQDVMDGSLKALVESEPGQIYHFSSPDMNSIKGLIVKIANLMDVSFEEHVEQTEERMGKDPAYILDCRKARDAFSWEPQIDLDQGLEQTISWVKENIEVLKQHPLNYVHKE